MLTGTPLDLTPFGDWLRTAGFLISLAVLALVLGLLLLALTKPRTIAGKLVASSVIVLPIAALQIDGWLQSRAFATLPGIFHAVCYESAYERIDLRPAAMTALSITPDKGVEGAYGFDLFHGTRKHDMWNGVRVTSGAGTIEGGISLRYQYLPKRYKLHRREVTIHGVKIEVVDQATGLVMAERMNLLLGNDFNRGWQCLGYTWFEDNDAFVERVIGPREVKFKIAEGHGRVIQEFVNARTTSVEKKREELGAWSEKSPEVLPPGSYRYDDRKIVLDEGSFPMVSAYEPLPIIARRRLNRTNVFLMLPNGWSRNFPPTQVLLHLRDLSGRELANVFAQVPPGEQWTSGWGMRPFDLSVNESKIEIAVYGDKLPSGDGSARNNAGVYRARYTMEIQLPPRARAVLAANEAAQ